MVRTYNYIKLPQLAYICPLYIYIRPHYNLQYSSASSLVSPQILYIYSHQLATMSGVWVFKNGVVRLVENAGDCHSKKLLVHIASNEAITSYSVLERKLSSLGWERYYDDVDLLQFHKRSTVHLISLPKDFSKFKSMHMYDIVVKNRNEFEVRDV